LTSTWDPVDENDFREALKVALVVKYNVARSIRQPGSKFFDRELLVVIEERLYFDYWSVRIRLSIDIAYLKTCFSY